jgi:hypothetical protein
VKIAATIFLLMISFLTVQPLLSSIKPVAKKSCSMKTSCHREESSKNSGKCGADKCNPFMACAYGNFYTVERNFTSIHLVIKRSEKILPANDNRLAFYLTDCWHPPEII